MPGNVIHCIIRALVESASVGPSTENTSDCKLPAIQINQVNYAKEQGAMLIFGGWGTVKAKLP